MFSTKQFWRPLNLQNNQEGGSVVYSDQIKTTKRKTTTEQQKQEISEENRNNFLNVFTLFSSYSQCICTVFWRRAEMYGKQISSQPFSRFNFLLELNYFFPNIFLLVLLPYFDMGTISLTSAVEKTKKISE